MTSSLHPELRSSGSGVQPARGAELEALAALSGQSTPLTDDQLATRDPDSESSLAAWDAAVDQTHAKGLVLDDALDALRSRGRAVAAERRA
jgi:hypothetical protein